MEVLSRSRLKRVRTADIMWQTLQERISADPDSSRCFEMPTDENLCSKCSRLGGLVVECKHCSTKIHLACARNKGLMLTPKCGVVFECPKHARILLFCYCKKPYDETRSMIDCSRCGDWYHLDCIDANLTTENLPSVYHCRNCESLEDSSTELVQLKSQNELKELRSIFSIRAADLITMLTCFEDDVCNVMDMLVADDCCVHVSAADIEKALGTYYLDIYEKVVSDCANHSSPDIFGLRGMLEDWKERLLQCERAMYDAKSRLDEACFSSVALLESIQKADVAIMNVQHRETSRQAYQVIGEACEMASALVPPPSDMSQYNLFAESIEWVADIYEVSGVKLCEGLLL